MGSINRVYRNTLLICLLWASTTQICDAQTFAEFFNQKKTQKKYMLQQIAALQLYIGYAKKGYDITNSGLQTIKGFTNGEFGLHSVFINSLKYVSPVIRNHVKVAEIINGQIGISNAFKSIQNQSNLSVSDQLYIIQVKQKIFNECGKDLDELLLVITSGKVEMSDEQRLQRLDQISSSMSDKYDFTLTFIGDVGILIRQTEKEHEVINQLKRYYEIN